MEKVVHTDDVAFKTFLLVLLRHLWDVTRPTKTSFILPNLLVYVRDGDWHPVRPPKTLEMFIFSPVKIKQSASTTLSFSSVDLSSNILLFSDHNPFPFAPSGR